MPIATKWRQNYEKARTSELRKMLDVKKTVSLIDTQLSYLDSIFGQKLITIHLFLL